MNTNKQAQLSVEDVMNTLEVAYETKANGLDWRDGERTLHELWRHHPERRANSYAIISLYLFAAELAGRCKQVLDLGCGTGFGTYVLAAKTQADTVVGIDLDEHAVKWGQTRYPRANLTIRRQDVGAPELDSHQDSFDLVFCSNVMEHVSDYNAVLKRVHGLLRPGGLYFQVTPSSGHSRGNKYHITNMTVPVWQHVLQSYHFLNQRFFAHRMTQKPEAILSEYDFAFDECGPDDMWPSSGLGSISGIIAARKSYNPKPFSLKSWITETNPFEGNS
jgi:2-polyprenyl-3-methyl-5-hydroxy-6-metoxy-1,4-benzoquinol methylase